MHDSAVDDDGEDDNEWGHHEDQAADAAQRDDDEYDEGDEAPSLRRPRTVKKKGKTPPPLPLRHTRGSEVTRPVKHDTWDNETEVESDFDQDDEEAQEFFEVEEEREPPPPHRKKRTGKPVRAQRQRTRR
ncbi:putative molybdenum cofactor biosynthesis protein [Trypanosoma rangeli]|uniref:Putative molybdenum cofactor biosynthesis protein n=1 Tax=Trypanosoma rangeli TaxID=5698 RepID=A0A422NKN4_TRYRA|nr:putative molybdenum cofactor biosynthesis protein [Trypanosoma rangeli]RNF05984.1 putative molybdenum cofactor biosynthesis protein [Trypanosoma rangeli]|eukprot:RNF05984.1 putative molybdenum cofactor biosynthesis protein [Trypanosoma rangeli]